MSELVQKCFHFVESEQCWLCFGGAGEVHHDGDVRTAIHSVLHELRLKRRHPGTRTFSFSRMKVSKEDGKKITVGIHHVKRFHFGMIDRCARIFHESDSIKVGCQSENAFFHVFEFKVGTRHLIVQVETIVF